jgi:hypothetical protein
MNNRGSAIRIGALCGMIAVAMLTGCEKKADPISAASQADKKAGIAAPGIAETKAIAEEAFIYGLPIVMNYAVMQEFSVDKNSGQYKAPFNTIMNEARVFTYKDTAVVTPNSDTPYSMLWLDLRAEPMVISVPAVPKERYYSVQFIDGNTYNYGYIGSRATGNEAGDYLVVGPDWQGEKPAGIKQVFRSTTPFALTIFRTQLFNAADMVNVEKVQAGYKGQPLSAFLNQPAPPAAPKIDFLPATTAGIKANFYEYLDAALQFVPVTPENKEIRARLASIGIGPGKTFEFKDLSLEHKAAVLLAMKEGDDKVERLSEHGNGRCQRLEDRIDLRRCCLLQRRLAEACRGGQGRHLWQRCRRGHVSDDSRRRQGRDARWQQAQLHAHFPRRAASAGQFLLVGDDVRRQDAAADREPDQPVPDQLADAARHEEECGRVAHPATSRRIHRARRRKRTGCLHRTTPFTWSCASTGRRRKRLPFFRQVRVRGVRRGSCRPAIERLDKQRARVLLAWQGGRGFSLYLLPSPVRVISAGLTQQSNSDSVTYCSAKAAVRSALPSRCAFFAISAARS